MDLEIFISETAKSQLDLLLQNSDKKCIRILAKRPSIYEDASFDLELDDPKTDDMIFNADKYQVIININLAVQLESISISYGGLLSRDKFAVEADLGIFKY